MVYRQAEEACQVGNVVSETALLSEVVKQEAEGKDRKNEELSE